LAIAFSSLPDYLRIIESRCVLPNVANEPRAVAIIRRVGSIRGLASHADYCPRRAFHRCVYTAIA
jgi:hypothetical protein